MQTGQPAAATVVPLMRYRDPAAAIEWLQRVFGLERHFVVGGEDGEVVYAQLTAGTGMVMLGPVGSGDFDSHLRQPDELGAATQSCYLAIEDIEAHFAHSVSNGAEIVIGLESGAFGSRGYSARDPEGHIWSFGSYDPWRGKRLPEAPTRQAETRARRPIARDLTVLTLCLAALAVAVSTVGAGWLPVRLPLIGELPAPAALEAVRAEERALADARASEQVSRAKAALAESEKQRTDAETSADLARMALSQSEAARSAAESALQEARLGADEQRAARFQAEQEARTAGVKVEELAGERSLREQAEARAAAAEKAMTEAQAAKLDADKKVEDLKSSLATETRAREDAEAAARRARDQLSRIEEAPKPEGSATVMTSSTGAEVPAAGVAAQSVATGGTASSAEASANAFNPNFRPRRPGIRVKAWERQIKPEPKRTQQEKKPVAKAQSEKPKKQAKVAKPAKPKPPAKKQDRPYLNVL